MLPRRRRRWRSVPLVRVVQNMTTVAQNLPAVAQNLPTVVQNPSQTHPTHHTKTIERER